MKKGILFLFALISALVLPLLAFQVHADAAGDRSYYISGYTINVNINADGSADVEEQMTYNYSGQFNGALRDVGITNTGGLTDQKVYVIKDGVPQEWQQNPTDSLDASGQPGTYNFVKDDRQAHFKIFEPSANEEKTFVIRYKLLDAVTKYNDIAEFNRKLIDIEWQTKIDNIYIKITLPEGAAKEDIRVFAHGPLTGESTILDERNVEFKVPGIPSATFVETLVLFPTQLVPEARNVADRDALSGILENEANLANEANRQRDEARQQVTEQQQQALRQAQERARLDNILQPIGTGLAILFFLAWFALIIYIYTKYDRELKHGFEAQYYRELPGEYTPAEMSVLMSFGYVNSRDIMATLMDLIRKKQLLLIVSKVHRKGLFGGRDETVYTIAVNDKAPGITLKKHEDDLISWFIGKIGNGSSVTLDEINTYVRGRTDALQFKKDYDHWTQLVIEEAKANKFFDESSKSGMIIGVLSGILYVGLGFGITALLHAPAAIVLILQGIFLTIFSARIKRRTAYGNEQHAMWHAFKNFLKDFSRLDKAEIPSVILWEHYLVYAISLGVAKEVIKQLPIVFTDDDLNNNHLTYMYGANYGYFAGFSNMFDNTIHTVEGALATATSIANSANSSSSGSGGGFSGGSSGGSSGGGGGAF